MTAGDAVQPDSTAIRTALWRALHVELDAAPHVLEDVVGLKLAEPDAEWRARPDMDVEVFCQRGLITLLRAPLSG